MTGADMALLGLEARGLNDHADTLRDVIATYREAQGESRTRIAILTATCRELLAELRCHCDDPLHRTPVHRLAAATNATMDVAVGTPCIGRRSIGWLPPPGHWNSMASGSDSGPINGSHSRDPRRLFGRRGPGRPAARPSARFLVLSSSFETASRMTTAIRIRPDSDRVPRLLKMPRRSDPSPGTGFCAGCWYVLPGCDEGQCCFRCGAQAARLGLTAAEFAAGRPTPPHIAAILARAQRPPTGTGTPA